MSTPVKSAECYELRRRRAVVEQTTGEEVLSAIDITNYEDVEQLQSRRLVFFNISGRGNACWIQ